jgi:hypothetical protein
VSAIPTPDKRTRYSSRRVDQVEEEAWPEFDEEGRGLLESVGDVIRPEPGQLLWDAGDAYDLYLVSQARSVSSIEETTGSASSSKPAISSASSAC